MWRPIVSLLALGILAILAGWLHYPAEAQTLTRTGQIAYLNQLGMNLDRNAWTTTYEQLYGQQTYEWMDWSADGCSVPSFADYATGFRSGQFETACERHDLSWRTLAVIDDGIGSVWNQRNRLAADRKFRRDMDDICVDEYPIILGTGSGVQQASCIGSAVAYYNGVRTSFWPPGTSATMILAGSLDLGVCLRNNVLNENRLY